MLGELVLPSGGEVWTGTIIDGLALLGFSEANSRQALARLGDDQLVESHRRGRKTRWRITASGRQLLETGAERIYGFGQGSPPWDGRWLVIHCAVPETMRRERHRLHTQLSFEGFGFLSATVAVSPYCHLEATAARILADLGLADTAVVLNASSGDLSSDSTILERAWDLTGLTADYHSFLNRVAATNAQTAAERFAAVINLVHSWRRFLFIDPEFPRELLPKDWIGHQARQLSQHRWDQWKPDAEQHYRKLESDHTS